LAAGPYPAPRPSVRALASAHIVGRRCALGPALVAIAARRRPGSRPLRLARSTSPQAMTSSPSAPSSPPRPRTAALAAGGATLRPNSGSGGFRSARASQRRRAIGGLVVLVVGGERFELPRPTLAMASEVWEALFAAEPERDEFSLDGDPESFKKFFRFFLGVAGVDGEVTEENVMELLHWGEELRIHYVVSMCESFLATQCHRKWKARDLLEVAVQHDLPLLYRRAAELSAHGAHHMEVPEPDATPSKAFSSMDVPNDVVAQNIRFGKMRGDLEMRVRHRFADHTVMVDHHQRSRLNWKTGKRFKEAPEPPPDTDWRKFQTVWPHHSTRGPDWPAVPREAQPTNPLRAGGVAAVSAAANASRGISPRRLSLPATP